MAGTMFGIKHITKAQESGDYGIHKGNFLTNVMKKRKKLKSVSFGKLIGNLKRMIQVTYYVGFVMMERSA